MTDWGIANGDEHTVTRKAAARIGQDLPEQLERAFSPILGTEWPAVRDMWRCGFIDLAITDGTIYAGMTQQQVAIGLEMDRQ